MSGFDSFFPDSLGRAVARVAPGVKATVSRYAGTFTTEIELRYAPEPVTIQLNDELLAPGDGALAQLMSDQLRLIQERAFPDLGLQDVIAAARREVREQAKREKIVLLGEVGAQLGQLLQYPHTVTVDGVIAQLIEKVRKGA